MTRPAAFTLIELLIVVTIIALLSSMAMTVLGIARNAARKANTEATLRVVHAALRLFQKDVAVLPWQNQPDAGVTPQTPATNALLRRLGRSLTTAERGDLNQAVALAAGKYAYDCDLNPWNAQESATQPSALTIRKAWTEKVGDWDNGNMGGAGILSQWQLSDRTNPVALAYLANRLSMQRARQAVLAGVLDLPGPVITRPNGASAVADLTATPLLSSADAVPAGVVGWCDDYLDGAIESNRMRGEDILDAYGNPMILVSQLLPKVHSSAVQIGFGSIGGFDSSWFGLGAVGFRPGSGPWAGVMAAKRWRLFSMGRIRLSTVDAGDGRPTPADATYLPDPNHLIASDRRWYAAAGVETDCELWSAGPNGTFAWRRDAAENVHAVPFSAIYDRGLR
jgi:prepilin-type N-terminal cleavage/methylation domain-containing protein